MHFRGKRIVHFVIQQVAALFANHNELLYCLIFFFKPRHSTPPTLNLYVAKSVSKFGPRSSVQSHQTVHPHTYQAKSATANRKKPQEEHTLPSQLLIFLVKLTA